MAYFLMSFSASTQEKKKNCIAYELPLTAIYYFKRIYSGERQAIFINRGESKAYLDPEKQANRFAAEFLMPSSMVIKMIEEGASVSEIMNIFRVSYSAASIKLENLSRNLGL